MQYSIDLFSPLLVVAYIDAYINCLGLTRESLSPPVNYVDFYRKWWSAVQLRQSLVATTHLARSRADSATAKSSIWSPAHDAERSNGSLPSNASALELPRSYGDQLTVPGCRHAVTSSPEAETVLTKLLALSNDNLRSWQHAVFSMYVTHLPRNIVIIIVIFSARCNIYISRLCEPLLGPFVLFCHNCLLKKL